MNPHKSDNRTVALVDWNWMGHHPTYFTHFAVAMAEVGADVVPFCADPEDFLKRLKQASLPAAVRERVGEPARINGPQPSQFRPTRWRGHYEAWRFFGGLGTKLRGWERRHNRKIDLVFFACIYDWQFGEFHNVAFAFPFPCSGLYLHARSFRMPGSPLPYFGILPCPEKLFGSRPMRSVCILDEGIPDAMSKAIGRKPVFVFPDITDGSLRSADVLEGLAGKLKAFAAGRPVVSLTGHLQWTKGLDVFTAAAGHSDMQGVCFFLGGEISWSGFTPTEKERIQKAWEELPNMLCHFQHLPEQTMNGIYAVSDVVVAAYRAFPNSSNALTKAAVFERPIVVSEGYLMAERVRKYRLGEVVPEGDVGALVGAIKKMVKPEYGNHLRSQARWEDYRQAHSVERLNEAFRKVIKLI